MEDARTPARRLGRAGVALLMLATALGTAGALTAATGDLYPLTFPVSGSTSYSDTWGAPRSEGRKHQGADIFAEKGTPVVAAADGTVMRMTVGERAGRYIVLEHFDGWRSYYLHLDNDTPGTDDGLAGAPAPGIEVGVRVEAGDVLDYVGDSGNAEETPSHLHFELHRPDGTAINPTPHLLAAQSTTIEGSLTAGTEWSTPVRPPTYNASGTEFVGHLDPGGGFAAGIAVHGDVAYVGTWGRPTACPAGGVRIVDVTDPTRPALLGNLASGTEFPGTSTDAVWVGSILTDSFAGDLAVVTVRLCDTSERHRWSTAFRGLALYDVTDPATPELLATVHSGEHTQGPSEVTAARRWDGTVVVAATVMQSLLHTEGDLGDFRLLDATDPRHPTELADWDLRRDLVALDGQDAVEAIDLHTHSVTLSGDGMTAWLAAWDGGVVMLDLADPTRPQPVLQIPVAGGSNGNVHTVAVDPDSGLLIRNDENLKPGSAANGITAWGDQTIYDISDLEDATVLATYSSSGATLEDGNPDYSGYFSAHEVVLNRDIEYVSWYSDGLRIVDLSDPSQPEEMGFFVPGGTGDPQRHWVTPTGERSFPMVWGVAVVNGLIYLSDMNSGLWIVRYTPPLLDPQPEAGSAT